MRSTLVQIGIWLTLCASTWAQSGDLFQQSADALLKRKFAQPEISFLLLDAENAQVISEHWPEVERPVPVGSLMKPFLAIANGRRDLEFTCRGRSSMCWRPGGHGRIGLATAIAHSCNAYFRELAHDVTVTELRKVASRFDLSIPPDEIPETLIGVNDHWKNTPKALARAYLRLKSEAHDDTVAQILRGMSEATVQGTSNAIGVALTPMVSLAKTGTAPCTHKKHAPGDGFALVMWPATQPKLLLLVRVHGKPGSQAAALAGEMILRIEASAYAAAD
jgi:cell division protein FtsI/penicillin-binding protein 2